MGAAGLLPWQGTNRPDPRLLEKLGVTRLYILEHPLLYRYSTERYPGALAWFMQQHAFMMIATGATPNGRDWISRLGEHLRLPFAPTCCTRHIHDESLFAFRSIYSSRS